MIEFLKILKVMLSTITVLLKSIREISSGLLPFKDGLLQQKLWSACGMQSYRNSVEYTWLKWGIAISQRSAKHGHPRILQSYIERHYCPVQTQMHRQGASRSV
jgi:hypothetical protein